MCKGLSETEARASHAVFVGRGRAPILQRSWEAKGDGGLSAKARAELN